MGYGIVRQFDTEIFHAELQFFFSASVTQKAVVPYSNETAWNNMEQETPDELRHRKRHGFLPVIIGIVLPPEGSAGIRQGGQTVVTYGNPVGVSSQILQDRLGPCKRRLDINNPLGFVECGK